MDLKSRPMINKPPPVKGLNIGIPIIIPIKGKGFINQGLHYIYLASWRDHKEMAWAPLRGAWPAFSRQNLLAQGTAV